LIAIHDRRSRRGVENVVGEKRMKVKTRKDVFEI
jgi:hypothetical protein